MTGVPHRGVLARDRSPGTARHAWTLGASSALAAAATWALQLLAGRLLGPADYASFMVVWGFVFLEVGLMQGLFSEVTRAVSADHRHDPSPVNGRPGARPVLAALGIAGALGICLLGSALLWAPRTFGATWPAVTGLVTATLLAYAVNAAVNGALAGSGRWGEVSLSIVVEALVRSIVVGCVLVGGLGLVGQSVGLASGGLGWLLLLSRRHFRRAFVTRTRLSTSVLTSGAVLATLGAAASSVVLAGFPLLLQWTAPSTLGAEAGVLIAALVATRAPILLTTNAFQGVVIAQLVAEPDAARDRLRRLLEIVALVTGGGAVGAALIGPWLLELMYGAGFVLGSAPLALLVVAAGLVAGQTLVGAALLARRRQGACALSWAATLAATVAVLLVDVPLETGVVAAALVGPALGATIGGWRLRRDASVQPPRKPLSRV